MKNKHVFGILILLLFSCKSDDFKQIEGQWLDKHTEMTEINIYEDSKIYWLEFYNSKHKITNQKTVKFEDDEHQIAYDKTRNVLVIGEKEFISKDDGVKYKFIGNWKEPEGEVFEISLENGGLKWIVKNSATTARYFPKKTNRGYTFTYSGEDLEFFIVDNFIQDSKGNKYFKI